jgi:hypothetical protein
MDEQAKQQAFIDTYNQLVIEYGFQLKAIIQTAQHGDLIQHQPQLVLAPADNPKPEITDNSDSSE